MNAPETWYNAERVSQSGSVILTEWKAQREAARKGPQASTPISQITPDTDMYDILTGGYGVGSSGMPVTEQTVMAIGAAYACVGLLGGALAALPFHLYKRVDDGRDRLESDLWWLFNESPSPRWTAANAWQFTAQSIGLKGDSFWIIRRRPGNNSQIERFEPTHPDRVQVTDDSRPGFNLYLVHKDDGTIEIVEQENMLHFSGVGFNGKRSLTPIRAALRPAAGIALAADEYAGAFFKNGARPDFALKTPGKLDPTAAALLRNTWAARHGGATNAHLPAILTGGLEVQQLTMSAEDAQLLATRKFQIEDIARIFGVPPHMIGYTEKSSSWGTGIEQMSIGFVRYTLRRYIDSITQEINRKIWPRSRINFGEFNVDALLEGDSKSQAEYFAKALGGPGAQGWMKINEVRRLKNLKPIAGGDDVIFAGSPAVAEPATNDSKTPEGTDNASNA